MGGAEFLELGFLCGRDIYGVLLLGGRRPRKEW